MSETLEITESVREKQIRESIAEWLTSSVEWSSTDLRYWIKGYKFIADDSSPYIWILRSLFSHNELKDELSHRIAVFLEKEKPYQKSKMTAEDDDLLFYNLFYLSAGLNYRQELGKQLLDIFTYFRENNEEQKDFFSKKKWYNLNNAFREALICNQIDNSLKEIWENGLNKEQTSFLVGDNYSYYRGIANLPSAEDLHLPDTFAISTALKKMADYLENKPERGQKFRDLIEYTEKIWSDYPDWNKTFLQLSQECEWQEWATVKLDSLIEPVENFSSDSLETYLVWDLYLPFLEELKFPYEIISKNGIIYSIKVSEETKLFLKKTSPMIEEICLNCPFVSYESVKKAAMQGFIELHMFFINKKEFEFANAIERGRIKTLKELGLTPKKHNIINIRTSAFDTINEWLEHLVMILKTFIPPLSAASNLH